MPSEKTSKERQELRKMEQMHGWVVKDEASGMYAQAISDAGARDREEENAVLDSVRLVSIRGRFSVSRRMVVICCLTCIWDSELC